MSAVDWVKDEHAVACKACTTKFSFLNRRVSLAPVRGCECVRSRAHVLAQHHCRNCGNVFCGKCSSKRLQLYAHKGPGPAPEPVSLRMPCGCPC